MQSDFFSSITFNATADVYIKTKIWCIYRFTIQKIPENINPASHIIKRFNTKFMKNRTLDLDPQGLMVEIPRRFGDEENEKTKVARISTHYSRTQCAYCCSNAHEIDLTD